jgi:hypothetical protein
MSKEIKRPRQNHQMVPPIRKTINALNENAFDNFAKRIEIGRSTKKARNPDQPFPSGLKLSKQSQTWPTASSDGATKYKGVKVFLISSLEILGGGASWSRF